MATISRNLAIHHRTSLSASWLVLSRSMDCCAPRPPSPARRNRTLLLFLVRIRATSHGVRTSKEHSRYDSAVSHRAHHGRMSRDSMQVPPRYPTMHGVRVDHDLVSRRVFDGWQHLLTSRSSDLLRSSSARDWLTEILHSAWHDMRYHAATVQLPHHA